MPVAPAERPPLWVRSAQSLIRVLPAGRYRIAHYLPRPAGAFWTRAARAVGGFRFACDLRDAVARECCYTGRYEPAESIVVRNILTPGSVCVDVGANWGYFTLLAAAVVGDEGRVLAVEPHPRLAETLRRNVERNGFEGVTILECAAADRDAPLSLSGFDADGDNWGVSRVVSTGANGAIEVRGATLDGLSEESGIGRIDLLKIDVEGAEDLALTGAHDLLTSGRVRRLLVELHPGLEPAGRRSARDLCAWIGGLGYTGFAVDHTPSALRRAAYGRVRDWRSLLRPLDADRLGPWPHILWERRSIPDTASGARAP